MAHPFDPVFPIQRQWSFDFAKHYINTGISSKLPISIFSRADSFYAQSPKKEEDGEVEQELRKIEEMFEKSLITDEERQRMRNKVLGL